MHPMTAAIAYARDGYRVFPCLPDKRPATPNGFKDATLDADQIRTWWTDDPDYLIGIATGSGLLVVDVDSYKPGGHVEWDDFISSNGGLPETRETRTGQGGSHYWFTVDQAVRSRSGDKFFHAIDIRGDGGYIIAPPSVSVYGAYTVVRDVPLAPAPQWLVDRINEAPTRSSGEVAVTDHTLTAEELARGAAYAERVVDLELARLRECTRQAVPRYGREPYTGPDWNQTTYEVACNLLEVAYSPWNPFTEEDAHREIMAAAPQDSGFGERDILARWDSARKTVDGTGRPMPPAQGGGLFIPFASASGSADPSSFFVKGEGLDVTRLAAAILELGPLAVGDTDSRPIWRYSQGVWKLGPHEVADRCAVILGPRFRVNHVTTVLPVIAQQCAARGDIITCDPVPEYINVRNGMLHWSTGHLYGHDPSFHSTVQLPVAWDPSATCGEFDRFAKEVMADDAICYLWEIIGYLIYSGNPLQRAFLFHGSGINGKGTLIRVLKSLLGESNISAVTLTDITEARFEVASLHGKIANLAGDIDATYMKSTAKFKAITGEDTIRAERKYEHGFLFQCWAVPVFSANEFWKSSDTTTGYKRRWQMLPFPNTFDVVGGQGLTERLCSETPGILVKAVVALQQLMARGEFDTPTSAQEEKAQFEMAADQVSEWLAEDPSVAVCDPANHTASWPAAAAYKAYRSWAEETGNSPLPSGKWGQRMQSLGYERYKSGVNRFRGLLIESRSLLYVPQASLN